MKVVHSLSREEVESILKDYLFRNALVPSAVDVRDVQSGRLITDAEADETVYEFVYNRSIASTK